MSPSFLVLDSYDEIGQRFLVSNGVSTSGDLYARMLASLIPSAKIDILYPAISSEPLPSRERLASYSGIMVTGSNLSSYDESAVVEKQKKLMGDLLSSDVPCFGTCWGLQLAMVVAGGQVHKNPRGREIGLARKITLTHEGRDHRYFREKPMAFDGFTSHNDEVLELPPTALLLASNAHSRVQAAVIHGARMRFFGLQYHPEYDLDTIAGLIRGRRSELVSNGYVAAEEEALHFANNLLKLKESRGDRALRYQIGIDDDVLNDRFRDREVYNWLKCEVL